MKSGLTLIVMVLDRSGSMQQTKTDAIGGFNVFLEQQKALPQEARATLALFNHGYELRHDYVPLDRVEKLNDRNYVPDGMTALLDAMGRTIDAVGRRLSETPEDERPEKVIFVTITDGEENHSKVYSHQRVAEMVLLQQETYGWEFVFIGANIDSFAVAGALNIKTGNTVNYAATPVGTQNMYGAVGQSVAYFRAGASDWNDKLADADPGRTA